MIETVGFVVLGQSSVDDVVPALTKRLPSGVRVLRRGALDGLTPDEIAALAPAEGEYLLVCKVEPGRKPRWSLTGCSPEYSSPSMRWCPKAQT
ncbi:MAG: AroM family protein [Anaerolineae bacterium]